MSNHQKTVQTVLSDLDTPVEHQTVEKMALYLNVDGTMVNIIELMTDLAERVSTLEEAP